MRKMSSPSMSITNLSPRNMIGPRQFSFPPSMSSSSSSSSLSSSSSPTSSSRWRSNSGSNAATLAPCLDPRMPWNAPPPSPLPPPPPPPRSQTCDRCRSDASSPEYRIVDDDDEDDVGDDSSLMYHRLETIARFLPSSPSSYTSSSLSTTSSSTLTSRRGPSTNTSSIECLFHNRSSNAANVRLNRYADEDSGCRHRTLIGENTVGR